jgi:G3E family GTPase
MDTEEKYLMPKDVKFVMVGGFLGAGKTTTLLAMARRLVREGQRVGLITNDQAEDLVDTGLAKAGGFNVEEIPGGCFCCRFNDLIEAADKVLDQKPDVLLGEPVGSCTDISATVIQPLKQFYGDWFRVAPFSVLVDPERARSLLLQAEETTLPENVSYLFQKQLEEADVILLNKVDLLPDAETAKLVEELKARFPDTPVLAISAREGTGFDGWVTQVLTDGPAGQRILDIDYDRYADAEAVLGWLNATVPLQADRPFDPRELADRLLRELRESLRERQAEIAHVKLLLTTASDSLLANLVSLEADPSLGLEEAMPAEEGTLVLNARVHISPEALQSLVEELVPRVSGEMGVEASLVHVQCFSPARPQPTHRFAEVVR